jgi:hypothetical protein
MATIKKTRYEVIPYFKASGFILSGGDTIKYFDSLKKAQTYAKKMQNSGAFKFEINKIK